MIAPLLNDTLVLDTPRLRLRPYTLGDMDIARNLLCV